MYVLLGHSRDLMGNCIGFISFFGIVLSMQKVEKGVFLPINIKLELGPTMSTLGGCAVCTLGGGTRTSGRIMLGPDEDMWTLCWKFVDSFPSSSSMTLVCTEGRGLVQSGCTFWGTMADFQFLMLWRVCYFLHIICRLGKYLRKFLNWDYLGVPDVGKWRLGCWIIQGIG